MIEHQYFQAVNGRTPNSRCRSIVAYILNLYTKKNLSVTKWRKTPPFKIEWVSQERIQRGFIDFNKMVQKCHLDRKFTVSDFGLPPLMSPLFDSPVEIGVPEAPIGSDGGTVKMRLPLSSLGDKFPIVPMIDREGFAIADMQTLVEQNIASLFRNLLNTSHLAPDPRSGWLTNFRLFVSECITAVDMMLHKVHLLAEYRADDLGWHFDAKTMGSRHGTRMIDKFKWVSQVSGRPFALTPSVRRTFGQIKDLRNHLSHFDPPCFAATMVEVCAWLNSVQGIGDVLWAIRKHLRQQLSESTVNILMLPRVEYSGKGIFGRVPPPHDKTIGYCSASWQITSSG